MSKRGSFFLALALLSVTGNAAALFSRTSQPASAVFHGVGPGGFRIEGKTNAVSVQQDDKTLSVVVELKDLTTGISLRDRHMREKYLDIERFPTARLDASMAALKLPAVSSSLDAEARGILTLHGKSKEVPFKYHISCDSVGVCDVNGTMAINMNDFGIVVPSYLGVTMKPEITIDTSLQVKK